MASKLELAETSKMIENVYRAVNIALVNELKMFFTKIDIDINEAIELASSKPFGYTKFVPGPGYGGHCIPLDPFYLYWLAKKNNFKLNFIKTAGEINKKVSRWIVQYVVKFIKNNEIKLYKNKLLLIGIAYKKDIDDIRESPALKIANQLSRKGYDFEYSDPYIKKINFNGVVKKSNVISSNLLKKYPIVLIITEHTKVNYKLLSAKAKYIFDTRNTLKNRSKNYFKI